MSNYTPADAAVVQDLLLNGAQVVPAERETPEQRLDRILWEVMSKARTLNDVRREVDRIAGITGDYSGANDDERIMGLGAAEVRKRISAIFANRQVPLTNYGAGREAPLRGGGQPPAQQTPPDKPRDFNAEARLLYPWIPEALLPVFVAAWAQYGDASLALGALRQDSRYDQFFPGNRRSDGSVRLSESEFLATQEGYSSRLRSFSPALVDQLLTPERRRQLIEGDVSVDEFGNRLERTYVGVMTRGEGIRQFYAQKFGAGDLSDLALFASAVDGGVAPMVFERNIRSAQIGGTAKDFGFDVARQEAERLESFGLDLAGSQQLYGRAASELPTLNTLMDRFNDPDDELTVEEYADALVIKDPEQLRQIQRLFRQSSSGFSGRSLYQRSQSGAVTGLLQR